MARFPRLISRYLGSVLVTALTLALRWWLDPYVGERAPFAMNIVAVVISAWSWGFGPGLLALGLGTAASLYLFFPPRGAWVLTSLADVLSVGLWLVNGSFVVLICEAQRAAHRRAETAAAEATRALASEQAKQHTLNATIDALRQSEERFRLLAEAMPQIVWLTDADGAPEYFNQRWFDYTGQSIKDSFSPEGPSRVVHPDDVPALTEAVARSAHERAPFEAEFRLRDRSGRYRWHLGRSLPVRDQAGRDVRRVGTTTDIDDRKRAECTARFLAETSAVLATIRDEATVLRQIAERAVPFFADWSVVDLLRDDGTVNRLAISHVEATQVERLSELSRRYPAPLDKPASILGRALHTGASELVVALDDDVLKRVAVNDEHLEMLRGLNVRSLLIVALKGRERILGTISFATSESDRVFGVEELRLAEDLAQRAAVAVENLRLTQELRDTDRRKDEFLATLAHELRNPLAPVVNALHLMRHQGGCSAQSGFGSEQAMIERQIGHLSRLVDDLLDVSRISRGKIDLRTRSVDLARVIRQAVEATRALFQAKRHALVIALPRRPLILEADPTRLEQILWNLLNNAAKYTEPGGRIELNVEVEAEAEGPANSGQCDWAAITVRDTGIGISAEVLPHIFELFVQADGRTDRAQGGLGIGLSLVHEFVRMHGGTIVAKSAGLGLGSEFVMRLPCCPANKPADWPDEPAEPARQTSAPVSARAIDSPRLRVLVVDDNVDAALSLVRVLTRLYGQVVRVAHDGPSALAEAREFHPEVVFLDIGLPGMDGYEVGRRLRCSAENASAMLVAVTGWGQDSDRAQTREAGFDRHLVKPVDPAILHEILCEFGASVQKS